MQVRNIIDGLYSLTWISSASFNIMRLSIRRVARHLNILAPNPPNTNRHPNYCTCPAKKSPYIPKHHLQDSSSHTEKRCLPFASDTYWNSNRTVTQRLNPVIQWGQLSTNFKLMLSSCGHGWRAGKVAGAEELISKINMLSLTIGNNCHGEELGNT